LRDFTLVGIAGEDNLDAPDLKAPIGGREAGDRHGRLLSREGPACLDRHSGA
jgi:hypothetical protein